VATSPFPTSAIGGVHAGAGAIQITDDASIDITEAVHGADITGQANILVEANGATSTVRAINRKTQSTDAEHPNAKK
jgi:hypothetical protein